jgi:PAS domain S-box-containing protein
MPPSPLGDDEFERLAELDRYAILSTPPEEMFDTITKLATRLFHCPIGLLSFVATNRQWFKSCIGLGVSETSRDVSLCSWVILSDSVLVVPDATDDPRFADNSLVNLEGGIRFYAGAPLISPRGFNIGTICIIDTVPRPLGLTQEETDTLTDLARIVITHLEARVSAQEAGEVNDILQTTLASIGDGVIAVDREGLITFMNPVAETLCGWEQEEARRRPVEEVFKIVGETSRQVTENPALQSIAEGRVVGLANHTVLLTKDGRELPIDDSGAPIHRGGSIVGGVLIFRDVTTRRAAERVLEYNEDQFRRTFANAPLGLVLTQLDGRFIESNEAYRKLTGYAETELHKISFISLTQPSQREQNRALFQQLVDEEIPSYVIDKRITVKNGDSKWVRAHASLLRDAAGQPTKVIGLVEDVTERKLAEERFRFLAESIPQMVWTASPDGLLDYVNGPGTEYFESPQESLLGGGWLAFVHPEDQAHAVARWSESLANGNNYETQFRLKRGSDQSWRLHLVRALPLIGARGTPAQWFGTCTDIEDQHQAMRQIEEDRRRWHELLYQTPAAIVVLHGPQHILEWMNPAYEALVGRSKDALCGRSVLEALPELSSQIYDYLLNNVYRQGEPFQGIEALARLGPEPNAKDVYLNFVYLPTRNKAGEIDGVFSHMTDVTEMVLARKTIEERESQFKVLAEANPHLTWLADETGYIFCYNQRWYDYTGSTLESMAGWGWQSVHDPDVLPEVLRKWHHSISRGVPFEMIFPLRGADGQFGQFLTRVEPIKDGQGNTIRWFGTNTDISKQLSTEEKLRRINRDLEEFSYVASHDLQEPLRTVNIYTELLLNDKGTNPEDREMFAGFIASGVKRMQTLLQDLLAFSRNVHAEDAVEGTADLSAAFNEAIAILKVRIVESGAIIETTALPVTFGETTQMAHVFQNVVSNALKYRKQEIAPRIQISAVREDNMWTISVADNGIGFDPEYAERIFGLFKRLYDKEYSGTGLGLAICKRIVERYGGRMWAESCPGVGSTFHFTVPIAP